MKQLAELVPIVLFFVANVVSAGEWSYRFDGIYSATAVLMLATAAQIVLTRLVTGHLEKRLLLLGAVVLLFGGATLVLRNQLFIQWKPTMFNWALALVFIAMRWWTGCSVMERAMGEQLTVPRQAWDRLDRLWIGNFLVVGALNLFVAYRFSEATWVSYKLWSAIGFTLLLSVLTVLLLLPYLRAAGEEPGQDAR
jgi:intracellular septation protein